jgi:hypothetical protein
MLLFFSVFWYGPPMTLQATHMPLKAIPKNARRCLSCGTTRNMARRRYCSLACRRNLKDSLNRRTGLLKALNIRYGTFYFTEHLVVLDLLPYDMNRIHSFIWSRSMHKKPVEDFCKLSEILGKAWWTEKNRAHRRYLASRHVLSKARSPLSKTVTVVPMELMIPSIKGAKLILLHLDKHHLNPSKLAVCIKEAYRRQAKKYHPDLGGDSDTFRKIHKAYENLMEWSKSPTFVKRSGFPDKWFYNGEANRWVQPTPISKTTL